MENLEIRKKLKKRLNENRYYHTLGVMDTAACMAMCHGADVEKALKAGLLHDCGKYPSLEKQFAKCEKYHLVLTESEKKMPALIHAGLGAVLAREQFQVMDEEILSAIRFHTTGRPQMTLLEKIVYLADYIEPGRLMLPELPEIRTCAFRDMDKAVALAAEATLNYLKNSGREADPLTEETYQYYFRLATKN